MFTGIIEELGTVAAIRRSSRSVRLQINAQQILDDLKPGDSVAVNGVCLTVDGLPVRGFCADVMPETIERTGLGRLTVGDLVNLERAMPVGGRFGGHIVSGHIDDTGLIHSVTADDIAVWLEITVAREIAALMVEKGSVAVDGVSLTVASVAGERFAVSLIPHTAGRTTLLQRRVGEAVNIECDILGKYLHRFLHPDMEEKASDRVTADFLRENGF